MKLHDTKGIKTVDMKTILKGSNIILAENGWHSNVSRLKIFIEIFHIWSNIEDYHHDNYII